MAEFPKRIFLEDTGERRHPKPGDIYFYRYHVTGEVTGPHINDDIGDEWLSGPEYYAIYRVYNNG